MTEQKRIHTAPFGDVFDDLTEPQQMVLLAFGAADRRSIGEVCLETKKVHYRTIQIIGRLVEKGYLTASPPGARWAKTSKGAEAIRLLTPYDVEHSATELRNCRRAAI